MSSFPCFTLISAALLVVVLRSKSRDNAVLPRRYNFDTWRVEPHNKRFQRKTYITSHSLFPVRNLQTSSQSLVYRVHRAVFEQRLYSIRMLHTEFWYGSQNEIARIDNPFEVLRKTLAVSTMGGNYASLALDLSGFSCFLLLSYQKVLYSIPVSCET
jgi:hypothetical protein